MANATGCFTSATPAAIIRICTRTMYSTKQYVSYPMGDTQPRESWRRKEERALRCKYARPWGPGLKCLHVRQAEPSDVLSF